MEDDFDKKLNKLVEQVSQITKRSNTTKKYDNSSNFSNFNISKFKLPDISNNKYIYYLSIPIAISIFILYYKPKFIFETPDIIIGTTELKPKINRRKMIVSIIFFSLISIGIIVFLTNKNA